MFKGYDLKINILKIILLIILFFALFVPNLFTRKVIAVLLLIYAFFTYLIIKKRDKASIYKKQVITQMIVFGIIYIAAYYTLGIFWGFYKNYATFKLIRITTYVLPFTVIIISSEIIRYELINHRSRISKILTFMIMVLIDIVVYWQMYNIAVLEDFLTLIGLITFASISCNLLYNYITIKFGYKPLIIYRLITIVSLYIIPIVPNVYTFLRATVRVIYPYIIYLFLEYFYSKDKEKNKISNVSIVRRIINTSITCIVAIFIVMIISCKFYVGIFAVGSGSMTGVINKGDAVVYFKYEGEEIKEGQIIVFRKNNITFVHRVINVMNINNEMHYITKGDYNEYEDDGYITNDDIIGFSKFRIRYIGYPTVWLSSVFS